jgi:hypothetical protein
VRLLDVSTPRVPHRLLRADCCSFSPCARRSTSPQARKIALPPSRPNPRGAWLRAAHGTAAAPAHPGDRRAVTGPRVPYPRRPDQFKPSSAAVEAHHSLHRPHDQSQVYWNFGGATVLTKKYIRITPSGQNRRGWLWNDCTRTLAQARALRSTSPAIALVPPPGCCAAPLLRGSRGERSLCAQTRLRPPTGRSSSPLRSSASRTLVVTALHSGTRRLAGHSTRFVAHVSHAHQAPGQLDGPYVPERPHVPQRRRLRSQAGAWSWLKTRARVCPR